MSAIETGFTIVGWVWFLERLVDVLVAWSHGRNYRRYVSALGAQYIKD